MFVAMTAEGKRVALLPFATNSDPPPPPYYCPVCREEVIMKRGSRRRPHFAHQRTAICSSEPESEEHLAGKAALYEWLKTQRVSPSLEVFLPAIQRKADILFTLHSQTFAVEFQCAAISSKEAVQRSTDYLSQRITPLWIYSSKRLRPPSDSSGYSIQAFEWTGLREEKTGRRASLVYFSPQKTEFYFLFPHAAASPSVTFADLYMLSLSSISVTQLVHLPKTCEGRKYWHKEWLAKKKQWRYQRSIWRNRRDSRYVRNIFAAHCSDIPYFPAEAGWPLERMYYFDTLPHLWQSAFLLKLFTSYPLYHSFSLRAAVQGFSPVIEEYLFVKELPGISVSLEKVIYHYLTLLEKTGLLQRNQYGWKKMKGIRLPRSLDEGFQMDKTNHSRIFY